MALVALGPHRSRTGIGSLATHRARWPRNTEATTGEGAAIGRPEPSQTHRDYSWLQTPLTIAVRGVCGGVFGLFVSLRWLRWLTGYTDFDTPAEWLKLGGIMLPFAVVAILYGDELWARVKSWW